jgi:hypothetical protein
MWTTTITISHWSIRHTDLTKEYPKRFHEGRTKGDFPPISIVNLKSESKSKRGEPRNQKPVIRVIEERSSSLVVTGDTQGFFWLCTIWSSLTKHKHLAALVKSLPAVLHSFIHQQASGRCLVFLILLGHLCERLAEEHERMLDHLNTVVDLGASRHIRRMTKLIADHITLATGKDTPGGNRIRSQRRSREIEENALGPRSPSCLRR